MRDYKKEYEKRSTIKKEIRGYVDINTFNDFKEISKQLGYTMQNVVRKLTSDFITYGRYTNQLIIDIENKIQELEHKIYEEQRSFL